MNFDFQHFLESRTSKDSSDTIIQELLGKVMNPEGVRGTSIYIYGEPATGKSTLGRMVCLSVPDYAQIVNLNYGSLDPKKKVIFVDEVYDGGVSVEDKVTKLVGSGYLVFILAHGEPQIPVRHTVVFERYDILDDLGN